MRDDLSPASIDRALAPLLGGAHVVGVDARPIGTGQVADSYRLAITYDRAGAGPATAVAKVPSEDPVSRAASAQTLTYLVETSFYRDLRPSLPVRAPHCLHVSYEAATDEFLLLLEDLSPARQGDQLLGCTPEQAETAVAELPKLHGPRWGDPSLARIGWLHRWTPEFPGNLKVLLDATFPGFCARYEGRIDADVLALADRFRASLAHYYAQRPSVWTIAHGDYRLDNLLFATPEGGPAIGVLDWQTVSHGPGIADLAYFIGAGLLTEQRRAVEVELVRRYQRGMADQGVELAWDDLWAQYRYSTFSGLQMAMVASMIVKQTDRGDEMFVAMAQRHGRHALDLGADEHLL